MRVTGLVKNIDASCINYKSKQGVSKGVVSYKPALNKATNNVLDSLGVRISKIQDLYKNFLNNWIEEQNKSMILFPPLSAMVTFFSKDRLEKVTLDNDKKYILLEDKNDNKFIFKDGSWGEGVFDVEDVLINIVSNNIDDMEEKANLIYLLSDVYLAKFFAEQEDDLKVQKNLHTLIECVTNMYSKDEVLPICVNELRGNLKDSSNKKFITKNNIKFERNGNPKFSITDGRCLGYVIEEFYDYRGNKYERQVSNGAYGHKTESISVNIKGFGNVVRNYNSVKGPYFEYILSPEGKEQMRYRFEIGERK